MKVKTKKCQHGTFSFYEDDMYVGKSLDAYGNYSEDEVEVFKQVLRPEDIAIEIGSNIGAHTVPMSRLCKRVYAFEPQPENYSLLRTNCLQNDISNVRHLMLAVGARIGAARIPALAALGHSNYGCVSLIESGGNVTTVGANDQPAAIATLDSTILFDQECPKVKLIKIDCEGMELEVLQGAEKLIARDRPIIYAENDRADKSAALTGWLLDHGYRCYCHRPPLFYKDNPNGNRNNVFGNYIVSLNMLCVPEEAGIEMTGLEETFDSRIDPDMYTRESQHWLRKAERYPDNLELSFRAAHFFNLNGEPDKARELITANLKRDPEHFGTRHLKGLLDLQAGDFANGWPAYELRYKMKCTDGFGYRPHAEPHWNGMPTQEPVLIWGEQGFGDNIMFVRFMDEVLLRAPNAILEIPAQLYELFDISDIVPKGRLYRIGRKLPPYTYHCSLPSLPATLGLQTEQELIRGPYLFADTTMADSWCEHNTISIGVCHKGGAASERTYSRDIPKDLLEPLASRFGPFMDLVNVGQFESFAETAAAIASLNLVLSVDTSVAHLAGALGVPTILMLSSDPDWRWQRGRSDSPWYTYMRIVRQNKFMDWSNVIETIADKLQEYQAEEAA